jgi:hypothetical protein
MESSQLRPVRRGVRQLSGSGDFGNTPFETWMIITGTWIIFITIRSNMGWWKLLTIGNGPVFIGM